MIEGKGYINPRPIDYFGICCIRCGESHDLRMFAHRNHINQLVGWIFACLTCEPFVAGGEVKFYQSNEKEK